MNNETKNLTALVLQGGGARGAYQVGVLKALAEIHAEIHAEISGTANSLPKNNPAAKSPFSIISGTSVGALNACALVTGADNFSLAVKTLERLWRNLVTAKIFNPSLLALFISLLKTIFAIKSQKSQQRGIFDNRPLRQLLTKQFNREKINKIRQQNHIDGFCINSSCYRRGVAISYFESNSRTTAWQRARRLGQPATITVDHIMASTALPYLFPAVKIDNTYHGDGALRLTEPLSPAIRLGATKLLAISVRDAEIADEPQQINYPTASEMLGYGFDIVFNDNLDADIERLVRINELLANMSSQQRLQTKYKKIDLLVLQPSKDLCKIAMAHENKIPRGLRLVLKLMSAGASDGRLASYMLFEPSFIFELIELGYNDTIGKRQQIKTFLQRSN